MGSGAPLQTIPNLPLATALAGPEQLWLNQAGRDVRSSAAAVAALAASVIGPGGVGGVVPDYATLRASNFPNAQTMIVSDPYRGGLFVRAPAGAVLRDNGGTVLVDSTGQAWERLYDGPVNARWFYSGPGYLGDNGTTAITAADIAANPQWIGMPAALGGGNYPVGTTWAYVALMEAIYACFAPTSTPGHVVWNTGPYLPFRAPAGYMRINQPFYLMASGIDLTFAQKKSSGLLWTGSASGVSPVMFDAISYGAIHNLSVYDQIGISNAPMVDVNWTGANPGLKTQQLTFYDWEIGGSGQADSVGVYIARHGGDAQGDTVCLVNPIIIGCDQGVIAGGANALSIITLQGNVQQARKNGYVAYGGSFFLYGPNFEVAWSDFHVYPQGGQVTLDGADAYVYPGGGASARCTLTDVRSENLVLSIDRNNASRLQNCGMAQGGFYGWGAGAHQHIGMLASTNGVINNMVICVDDGGPAWFTADAASTNTRIVKSGSSPGWAVNQWAGYERWFRYGNGYSFAGTLTASDANSITDPTGFYQSEPFPGFVPGMLAGYLVKIMGVSGSVQPAWDSFPPGQSSIGAAQGVGYGFTTYAGSNVVSTGQSIANGNYAVVCDAVRVQAPPASTTICPGALIGKIQNLNNGAAFTASLDNAGNLTVSAVSSGTIKIGAALSVGSGVWFGTVILGQTSGTPGGAGVYTVSNPQQPAVASRAMGTLAAFEVVSGLGEPLPASRTLADSPGYWGAGIPDGQVTWLPVDFDVIAGAASIDNVSAGAYGKFRNLGIANFAWDMSFSALARIRPAAPTGNFTYRNGSAITQSLAASVGTANPLNVTIEQLATQGTLVLSNALAAFTLNMPVWLANITQPLRLYITNQNAGAVLTWGTNVKVVAPTVNLGAAGKISMVDLTWVGDAQTWLVTNVQGPL